PDVVGDLDRPARLAGRREVTRQLEPQLEPVAQTARRRELRIEPALRPLIVMHDRAACDGWSAALLARSGGCGRNGPSPPQLAWIHDVPPLERVDYEEDSSWLRSNRRRGSFRKCDGRSCRDAMRARRVECSGLVPLRVEGERGATVVPVTRVR